MINVEEIKYQAERQAEIEADLQRPIRQAGALARLKAPTNGLDRLLDWILRRHQRSTALARTLASRLPAGRECTILRQLLSGARPDTLRNTLGLRTCGKTLLDRRLLALTAIQVFRRMSDMRHRLQPSGPTPSLEELLANRTARESAQAGQSPDPKTKPSHPSNPSPSSCFQESSKPSGE